MDLKITIKSLTILEDLSFNNAYTWYYSMSDWSFQNSICHNLFFYF